MVFIHAPVRQDDDVAARCRRTVHGNVELVQRFGQRCVFIVEKGNLSCLEAGLIQMPDLQKIHPGQDGMIDLQHGAVAAFFLQKITVRADIDGRVGHDLFPQGVDGRIGHLGKQLLEIVEQELMSLGEHGQRSVMSHGKGGLHSVFRHGKDLVLHILIGIAEHLVEPVADLLGVDRDLVIGDRKLVQMQQISVQPFPVGPPVGIVGLALLVGDDPLLLSVDQQDPAGLQAGFFYNGLPEYPGRRPRRPG